MSPLLPSERSKKLEVSFSWSLKQYLHPTGNIRSILGVKGVMSKLCAYGKGFSVVAEVWRIQYNPYLNKPFLGVASAHLSLAFDCDDPATMSSMALVFRLEHACSDMTVTMM